MATKYLRSTDGNDAEDGSTWALADATMAASVVAAAAGGTSYVSQVHAETSGATTNIAIPGTATNPSKIICGNDAAEPPTAVAVTATVTTTASAVISVYGSAYIKGIGFISSGACNINTGDDSANSFMRLEDCSIQCSGTGIRIGNMDTANTSQETALENCTFKTGAAGHTIQVGHDVRIKGGSFLSGTAAATNVFSASSSRVGRNLTVDGFDFTNLGGGGTWTGALALAAAGGAQLFKFRNCKLPTWSGVLVTGTILPSQRFEMWNCDAGDTNYRLWIEDYLGSIKHETTIVMTSGASDGTTPFSWKMASSASASYPTLPLKSPEIFKRNETTGSSKTVTVEFVHDTNVAAGQGAGTASAFQDNEVWLEVQYLGTSGFPLATFISDKPADVLAAAADQASSSVTWTTTGLTTPVKQALSVTFTPQEKGMFIATVHVGKASKTIYVNPDLVIS